MNLQKMEIPQVIWELTSLYSSVGSSRIRGTLAAATPADSDVDCDGGGTDVDDTGNGGGGGGDLMPPSSIPSSEPALACVLFVRGGIADAFADGADSGTWSMMRAPGPTPVNSNGNVSGRCDRGMAVGVGPVEATFAPSPSRCLSIIACSAVRQMSCSLSSSACFCISRN
jgi:hypothetical protein